MFAEKLSGTVKLGHSVWPASLAKKKIPKKIENAVIQKTLAES